MFGQLLFSLNWPMKSNIGISKKKNHNNKNQMTKTKIKHDICKGHMQSLLSSWKKQDLRYFNFYNPNFSVGRKQHWIIKTFFKKNLLTPFYGWDLTISWLQSHYKETNDRTQMDENLSLPWSHSLVLNPRPLD